MRTVQLGMHVPARSAAEVYRTLADFERYPTLSDAVQSVTVTAVSDTETISQWEVTFRAGLLRWTEEDRFDHDAREITFRQIEGDVELFDGTWRCSDADGGCDIAFTARLDMGIPSLADALEPIAARTLVDNTIGIVTGLVGDVLVTSTEVTVPSAAGVSS